MPPNPRGRPEDPWRRFRRRPIAVRAAPRRMINVVCFSNRLCVLTVPIHMQPWLSLVFSSHENVTQFGILSSSGHWRAYLRTLQLLIDIECMSVPLGEAPKLVYMTVKIA